MDERLSSREVIASPQYGRSLQNVFREGVARFGRIQAEKYLKVIMDTVERLEIDYPFYPECRHLATRGRIYRNIILDAHLIIYRIAAERIEVLDIVHSASSLRRIRGVRKIKLQ